MDARAAFVLNLDADLELAVERYAPTRSVERAIETHAEGLARALLREGDAWVRSVAPDGAFSGFVGRAFSPTPRALAELARVGAIVPEAPSVAVLRRVSRRDFAYREELPDSIRSDDAEVVLAHLREHLSSTRPFRAKRVHGMAGRGHRVIRAPISSHDEAWIRASRGLVIEPNVAIVAEFALHGFLARDRSFVRGAVVRSEVDVHGAWRASARVADHELDRSIRFALAESLDEAADALGRADYFGPFGIDAFIYDDVGGPRLRARSEVHARYSMGWPVGMALLESRPDLGR